MYNVFSTREIGVLKVVNLMLTARQMLIFKCIVEEFIENAEPVGSKALMVKYQLPYSSATIRNEMNFLENYGYLEKTHISSVSSILLSNHRKPCFLPLYLGKEKTPH